LAFFLNILLKFFETLATLTFWYLFFVAFFFYAFFKYQNNVVLMLPAYGNFLYYYFIAGIIGVTLLKLVVLYVKLFR